MCLESSAQLDGVDVLVGVRRERRDLDRLRQDGAVSAHHERLAARGGVGGGEDADELARGGVSGTADFASPRFRHYGLTLTRKKGISNGSKVRRPRLTGENAL